MSDLTYTVVKHDEPSGKKYYPVDEDGVTTLGKKVLGGYKTATAYRVQKSLEELAQDMRDGVLTEYHLLMAGVNTAYKLHLDSKTEDKRSKANFPNHSGCSLLIIDSDCEYPVEQIRGQLAAVEPALANVSMIHASSSSSYISIDGVEVNGLRGTHTYLALSDGLETERVLTTLHTRLVNAGFGWIKHAVTGLPMPRSVVDVALKTSSQPAYQRAYCVGGVTQSRQVEYIAGSVDVLDASLVAPLTDSENSLYKSVVSDMENEPETKAEGDRLRHIYVETEVERRVKEGMAEESARSAVTHALDGGELDADWLIYLRDGVVTVGEILSNPEQYHNTTCADPLEPEYNGGAWGAVGKIYTDKSPVIHSKAHGTRNFKLKARSEGQLPEEFFDSSTYNNNESVVMKPNLKVVPLQGAQERYEFKLTKMSEAIQDLKPPIYCIENLLIQGYLYTLTARQNHGKTTLMALMAACISRGEMLGDRRTVSGPVLILSGENSYDTRLKFKILTIADKENIYEWPHSIDLKKGGEKLVNQIREFYGDIQFRAVFVDSLQAYFGDGDMNGNSEALALIKAIRQLTTINGNPTVVALAHPVKNADKDSLVPYGGGSIMNEIDTNLTLWLDGNLAVLHHTKARQPSFFPQMFELEAVQVEGLITNFDQKVTTTRFNSLDYKASQRIEEMETYITEQVLLQFDNECSPSFTEVGKAVLVGLAYANLSDAAKKSQAEREIKRLLKDGFLAKNASSRYEATHAGKKEIKRIKRIREVGFLDAPTPNYGGGARGDSETARGD